MSRHKNLLFSRRSLLKSMGLAPLILRPAPFFGSALWAGSPEIGHTHNPAFPFADVRLTPHYPSPSPLASVLRLVAPGSDSYITEKYAFEIQTILDQWSVDLRKVGSASRALSEYLDDSLEASPLAQAKEVALRSGGGIETVRRQFRDSLVHGRDQFLRAIQTWLSGVSHIETAEFEITSILEIATSPTVVQLEVRYSIVATRNNLGREERVGAWKIQWISDGAGKWKARRWEAREETLSIAGGPGFVDVTRQALGKTASYASQIIRGADYWRTILDGACGIDVYGNNGVALGDYDNDGFDDLYVCQPAGLPNRLYRNRGDGTFEDVTEKSGVGVLDNSACALFADFDNRGLQDLLVVCGSGPLLFRNQGDGTFAIKRDAFQFASSPKGTFTHAAIADYDGDGRLDIYFCMYSYYLGLDQYHYPVPYFDARNGPGNCLMHNEGNGKFIDKTEAAGLNVDNDRYSFACAWGHTGSNREPDLLVANDFGRCNLYRNNGDGTFQSISKTAHTDDVGAGMSASWSDFNNDGHEDAYVANMWSSAGQRVSEQKQFHQQSPDDIRTLYQRHARGNALFRNLGDGRFQNISQQAGVEMGRWSWCSDFFDFDQDGYPDLYVVNGYISAPESTGEKQNDLGSFFWRQVVANSPDDATPSLAYEHGWNALNELIRSDISWSGHERNVLFANNRDGTFSEVSGVIGLDFPEDSRSFALADLDQDGRLEIVLKNRNAPQLRILHNEMRDLGHSIAFRLRGHKSNRDAIGTAVTIEAGPLRQTKYLETGSGFLAQHSKEVFFGLGAFDGTVKASIQWPSGLSQIVPSLPVNHRISIEEGLAQFDAKPFASSASAYATSVSPLIPEPMPSQIGTWLIEPLKAPEFSLSDLTGTPRDLKSYRGEYLLLTFWATTASSSRDQLVLLDRHRRALAGSGLTLLAINCDDPAAMQSVRSFASEAHLTLPILFATEEVAGVYNIICRYLFDRRRDLAFPTSLLLDKSGMIFKIYQGSVDIQQLHDDINHMPATAAERMQLALSLGGVLYQGTFQRNDFTYGVAMFQHGYLDQAAESFQQVIAAKPAEAEGYYNLGTLNLRRNNIPDARRYLEQTLKLRPNYPEAWNNLGMIAAQEGHADEAVQAFEQSLQLRPGYAIALLNLGNVYRRKGDYAKALESLNHALQLQPDDSEINYSIGMLYAQQGEVQPASNYLRRAIDLKPDNAEALNNLGILFVRQHDYPKAKEQFENCIQRVPNFDQSYLNLARVYAILGDKLNAAAVLNALLRQQPQSIEARRALEMLK